MPNKNKYDNSRTKRYDPDDAPSVAQKRRENQKPDKQVRIEERENERQVREKQKEDRKDDPYQPSAEGFTPDEKLKKDVEHGMAPDPSTTSSVDPDDDGPDGVRRVNPNEPSEEVKVGTQTRPERIKRPDLVGGRVLHQRQRAPDADGHTGSQKDWPSQGGPNVV